jgi:hypothetical protein
MLVSEGIVDVPANEKAMNENNKEAVKNANWPCCCSAKSCTVLRVSGIAIPE